MANRKAHKWTVAQRTKFVKTMSAKRGRAANASSINAYRRRLVNDLKQHEVDQDAVPKSVVGIYDGQEAQAPAVDVNRIEDRAFRRGLFTGLQMVVDLLIRELR